MPRYSFVTLWRLNAPVEDVFATIADSLAWPHWWPSVVAVEESEAGGPDGLGSVRRYTFRGRLPYLLRFDMLVTAHEPPTRLIGRATGELDGEGRWSLSEAGDWTTVRYEWDIRTTRRWMNALGALPFVDAIFRLNHHAVMRAGLAGIRRRLGVRGEYEQVA